MSWIQKLHDTYEQCASAPQFEKSPPLPVNHVEQQAHIEIVLDQKGNFLRASPVNKEVTAIPATEDSAGRTAKIAPHSLCDKIQYCASDYSKFGGEKESGFEPYIQQLRKWQGEFPTAKGQAVLRYVEKGTIVADLVEAKVLHCGPDGRLLTEWTEDSPIPEVLKMMTPKPKEKTRDQGDAFIRWRVQIPDEDSSAVWEDPKLRQSWIQFQNAHGQESGLCMVTGEMAPLAENHPKRLRHGGDGAKLLSSNDGSGFTFRGRFEKAQQAYGVGSVVTQKAHNALRWLIGRQAFKSGDQVFVAWAVNGTAIPDPFADSAALFGVEATDSDEQIAAYTGDAGQHFALRLKRAISGYRSKLSDTDDVVVMGLDSATPGRMAIIYYRELTGSEFLDRINDWHTKCAWLQAYSKTNRFEGAPAPRDIAEAAYGPRIDDKLRRATVERLLPCIIDGRPLPRDLVESAIRRACNRAGKKEKDKAEWEKCLGIACSLVRSSREKENYQMALEENRATRDYLFGRLLAIAENIERRALHLADEKRDTNAERLMQRFADHPSSTWVTIYKSLDPYRTRLRANRPSILLERDKLLDAVVGMFAPEDFTSDKKLTGEFLLGYHCQRSALWPSVKQNDGASPAQKTEADETKTGGKNE